MATKFVSVEDLEKTLGEQFKRLRLDQDVDQRDLAERAGVGLSSLKSLENGKGSTLATIVKVARALGKVDWIESFYPIPEISPIELLRAQEASKGPQRASNNRTRHYPRMYDTTLPGLGDEPLALSWSYDAGQGRLVGDDLTQEPRQPEGAASDVPGRTPAPRKRATARKKGSSAGTSQARPTNAERRS